MNNKIVINMLGYRSAGKTSYLLAAAHNMRDAAPDGFAMEPDPLDQDTLELKGRWAALQDIPHEWPVEGIGGIIGRPLLYHFEMTYKGDGLYPMILTWGDHRGGDASWIDEYTDMPASNESVNVQRLRMLINQLDGSDCIFLCIPGDILSQYRHQPEKLRNELQVNSLRRIIGKVGDHFAANFLKPLPIAVIITMADCIADDRDATIKELVGALAWLNAPRGLLSPRSYLVGYFPVTLGLELYDNKDAQIAPRGVRAPVLFAAWAHTRQLISAKELESLAGSDRLRILGTRLGGYPIAQDEVYLRDAGKLVPANRVQPVRVFISHASEDNEFCRKLKTALEGAGAEVWFDETHMHSGSLTGTLTGALREKVEEYPTTIVILSPHAFKSLWVQEEVRNADDLRVRDKRHFRDIIAVTAAHYDEEDLNIDSFKCLQSIPRIEAKGFQPESPNEAIAEVLRALYLPVRDVPTEDELERVPSEELVPDGNALLAQERYEAAVGFFEQALHSDPDNYETLTRLAFAYLMIGEPVKSLCESRHALASNPHDATAWELSGVATQSLGESYLPEAVEAYNQALARDDQNPDTWSNFAAALYDLERHHEALDAINRALQLDDSMSYRWNLHGDILTWLGDKASASVSYARAFEIDKRMVDAWNIKVGPSTLQ